MTGSVRRTAVPADWTAWGGRSCAKAAVARAALALALTAAAAPAQEAVTPDAFRAYAEGWTLHFELDGAPFGAEVYAPGGEVLWKPEGGPCQAGVWVPSGGAVCFVYDGAIACWRIFRDAAGLSAEPAEGGPPRLRIARRDRAPLSCAEVPSV